MNQLLRSISPDQLVGHVSDTLRHPAEVNMHSPAFTLVLGAGFSYGVVPTTSEMMRREIGAWCSKGAEGLSLSTEKKKRLTRLFWRRFNQTNPSDLKVAVDAEGLPTSASTAYQRVTAGEAQNGLQDISRARDFLRAMATKARTQVNEAHFYLACLLEEQQRTRSWARRPFCRTIFTTNFDPLLQTSLQLVHLLYFMTDRPELSIDPGHLREDETAIHLVYVHGSMHRPYLANSQEEIGRLDINAPSFQPYLESHGVIVIGYGGWEDSIMKALERCAGFAHNLYWCDIHPADEAPNRLSTEAMKLLSRNDGHRFYVPLEQGGAGAFMGALFNTLVKGIPRLLKDPFEGICERLEKTTLSAIPLGQSKIVTMDSRERIETPPKEADEYLKTAIQILRSAQSAFLKHETGPTPQALHVLPKPVAVDLLLASILDAGRRSDFKRVIELCTKVLRSPDATLAQRAEALTKRSSAYEQLDQLEKELDDYTSIIKLRGAPAEYVAFAHVNRGVVNAQNDRLGQAIRDFTLVIKMRNVPVEWVAHALFNRGVAHGDNKQTAKEIDDYTKVVNMRNAPAEWVALALNNRGIEREKKKETAQAIDDYTRIIKLRDAPAEWVAQAFLNRGVLYAERNQTTKAIDDYTQVTKLRDATPETIAQAVFRRGWIYGKRNRYDLEIEDYTRVIKMRDAPAEWVAQALFNRGVTLGENKQIAKEVNDYTRVIKLRDAPVEWVAQALLNRGVAFAQKEQLAKAIDDYTRVIKLRGAPAEWVAQALLNRAVAYEKRKQMAKAIGDYTRVLKLPGTSRLKIDEARRLRLEAIKTERSKQPSR